MTIEDKLSKDVFGERKILLPDRISGATILKLEEVDITKSGSPIRVYNKEEYPEADRLLILLEGCAELTYATQNGDKGWVEMNRGSFLMIPANSGNTDISTGDATKWLCLTYKK